METIVSALSDDLIVTIASVERVVGKGAEGMKDAAAETYVEAYLYDLEHAPYELKNLVGMDSHRQMADRLRERLQRRMAEAGEKTAAIEPAEPRTGGQRRVPDEWPNR